MTTRIGYADKFGMHELMAYRKRWGLSREDLAKRAGISVSFLHEIELGASCSLETAVRLEEATDGYVTPTRLYRDSLRIRKAKEAEPPRRGRRRMEPQRAAR